MSQPTVSIIMNCLNCARDLPEALKSVSDQTFQDYEIVFWDNGSSDGSGEIAKAFGPKLRYYAGSETVPLGAARNLAIARARGKYIAFLDCDDLWRPTKLERQVNLFRENPRLGLVCVDTEFWDGKRVLARLFAQTPPARGKVYAELLQRQWISMSSAMVSREALDSVLPEGGNGEDWFDESLNVCEEADLFYRIAQNRELDFVDRPLSVWRVHGDNTTFCKFAQFADETTRILEKHKLLYPQYYASHPELERALRQRAAFQKAVALWRDGQNIRAREVLAPWRNASRKYRLFWLASYLPGVFFDFAARLYFALPAKFRLK